MAVPTVVHYVGAKKPAKGNRIVRPKPPKKSR